MRRISDEGFETVEDPEGRFKLTGVSPGRGHVVVRAKGFADGAKEVAGLGPGANVAGVVVALEPEAVVEGLVRDSMGARIQDAKVYEGRLPGSRTRDAHVLAETDENGLFEFQTGRTEQMTLVVWHPDYSCGWTRVTPELGVLTECTVVLARDVTVRGVVRVDGRPAGGRTVFFVPQFDAQLGLREKTATDDDGTFEFTGLPSCDAKITATAANGRAKEWNGFLDEGQVKEIVFDFAQASCTVEGRVLFEGQVPPDASLSLLVFTKAGEEGRYARIDEEGRFRFDSVPAGPVSLTVDAKNAAGKLGFDEKRFRLREGDTHRVEFQLKPIDKPITGGR